jgi:hypothetical protein
MLSYAPKNPNATASGRYSPVMIFTVHVSLEVLDLPSTYRAVGSICRLARQNPGSSEQSPQFQKLSLGYPGIQKLGQLVPYGMPKPFPCVLDFGQPIRINKGQQTSQRVNTKLETPRLRSRMEIHVRETTSGQGHHPR